MDEALKHKRIRKLEMMHDDFITRAEDLYLDNKINESVNYIYFLFEIELLENYPKLKENFDALLLLGSCYQYKCSEEGNTEMALDCYLQADKIEPRNAFVKNLIGYLYMVQNKSEEALLFFRDAVNYDTGNIMYRLNLVINLKRDF